MDKLKEAKLHSPVAMSNILAFSQLLQHSSDPDQLFEVKYDAGDEIVSRGEITDQNFSADFQYAYVALGFILEGDVIVNKGGKDTKKLSRGDFIGLFETSDWLLTHNSREIGPWTLTADSPVYIVFIGSRLLSSPDAADFKNYLIDLARNDSVPQPITNLPLLDWTASHTTKGRLKDYAIIAHTHFLPNNVPFFRHLAYLVEPDHIFLLEKPYSTVQSALTELVRAGCEIVKVRMETGMPYEFAVQKSLDILWRKVLEEQKRSYFSKILIIDDGGDIWHSLPWAELGGIAVAGVEQTQRGITRIQSSSVKLPPIVSVATSGVKKELESIFIGRAIVNRLQEIGVLKNKPRIGILGAGNIGQTIAKSIKDLDLETSYYDPNAKKLDYANHMSSLDSLLDNSDIIIGTTGKDALKGTPYERVSGHKILASASSADVEFASPLKMADNASDPFSTRQINLHENLTVEILNGGYPINFTREKDATPDEDIVLTRCLMYIGAMQAADILENSSREPVIYELDPVAQGKLIQRWLAEKKSLGRNAPIPDDQADEIIVHVKKDLAEWPTVWFD